MRVNALGLSQGRSALDNGCNAHCVGLIPIERDNVLRASTWLTAEQGFGAIIVKSRAAEKVSSDSDWTGPSGSRSHCN